MLRQLSKHPSNIAKAAVQYLKTLSVSAKTKKDYEEVLDLFIESLCSDPSSVVEGKDGSYLLAAQWDAYYGGAVDNFLNWWFPRKVLGADDLHRKAPGILRKWLKWCYEQGYFAKQRYDDFMEALPRGKGNEVKRLQKAGDLLYRLHTPDPGAWLRGEVDKVVPIFQREKPQQFDEGYMKILRFEGNCAYLENEEGKKRGPVMLSMELVKLLRVGDVMNVGIGKYGRSWRVLESGNVYGEGALF
jgi:hypothetical protein